MERVGTRRPDRSAPGAGERREATKLHLQEALDVDAPALLLTGTDRSEHLRESVRAVHEALPESRLVEFEDLGHIGPAAAPERVAGEVTSFLREEQSD